MTVKNQLACGADGRHNANGVLLSAEGGIWSGLFVSVRGYPSCGFSSRFASNALLRPSQSLGSLTQGILARSTLGMLKYLLQGTLQDVQTCQTAKMMCGHMLNHVTDPAFCCVCLDLRNCISCCRSFHRSTVCSAAMTRKGSGGARLVQASGRERT
jgi:hypothetical protein